jgi:hypothetical protein
VSRTDRGDRPQLGDRDRDGEVRRSPKILDEVGQHIAPIPPAAGGRTRAPISQSMRPSPSSARIASAGTSRSVRPHSDLRWAKVINGIARAGS